LFSKINNQQRELECLKKPPYKISNNLKESAKHSIKDMMNKSSSGVLGRNILGHVGSSSTNARSARNNIVKDNPISNINIPLSLRKCASNGFLASTDDSDYRDDCQSVSQRG